MEDGSFTTVEEEEYNPPEGAAVTLVHPVDMEEGDLQGWQKQLADYEILQPVRQLTLPVKTLLPKDLEERSVIRYRGLETTVGTLLGLSKKYSLGRGDVLDGGAYTWFALEDPWLKAGFALSFDDMYMSMGPAEKVTLDEAAFYRIAGEGDSCPFAGGGIQRELFFDPAALPNRFAGGILSIFDWKAWSIPRSLLRKIYHPQTSCKTLFGSGYGPRQYNKFPIQRRYPGGSSWVLYSLLPEGEG
jgi:hypothetical protein